MKKILLFIVGIFGVFSFCFGGLSNDGVFYDWVDDSLSNDGFVANLSSSIFENSSIINYFYFGDGNFYSISSLYIFTNPFYNYSSTYVVIGDSFGNYYQSHSGLTIPGSYGNLIEYTFDSVPYISGIVYWGLYSSSKPFSGSFSFPVNGGLFVKCSNNNYSFGIFSGDYFLPFSNSILKIPFFNYNGNSCFLPFGLKFSGVSSPKFIVNYGSTTFEYNMDDNLSIYLKSPVVQSGTIFTYAGSTGINLFYNGTSQFYSKDKLFLNTPSWFNNNVFTPICL